MLSRWPIKHKLTAGVASLFLIVAILSLSGFRGVYAYRHLAKSISRRSAELPLAEELAKQIGELRHSAGMLRQYELPLGESHNFGRRFDFRSHMLEVRTALERYRGQLAMAGDVDTAIDNKQREWDTVHRIEESLQRVTDLGADEGWVFNQFESGMLQDELNHLNNMAKELPHFLHERMKDFSDEVRGEYRTLIIVTWTATVSAVISFGTLIGLFFLWVYRPLLNLIRDSRIIANGKFEHRVRVTTRDEIAELGQAMNDMTARFEASRDELQATNTNLDQKIQQRESELQERAEAQARSEQLASVGYMAAGVAHEINNPLQAIAMCAEALETRLQDVIHADDALTDDDHNPEIAVLRKYLRRIQDEAFRCKGITEKLLDFSRRGPAEKENTDLRESVLSMIELVQTLGKYRESQIEFTCNEHVVAIANEQEMKQVVLNLLTNALESLGPGGKVNVTLRRVDEVAELIVADNGCGMSDEVLQNLFRPFFTRRREGNGTGLGLSIAHRIISEHHGSIQAASDGPGRGSRMRVTLPLANHEKQSPPIHETFAKVA